MSENDISDKVKRLREKLEHSINDSILRARNLFPFMQILSITTDGEGVKVDGLGIDFDSFIKNISTVDMYLSENEQSI